MNSQSKYLLLIDPKQEILNLQETALKCFYSGEVHSSTDYKNASSIILKRGHPELLILDSTLVGDIPRDEFWGPVIATTYAAGDKSFDEDPFISAVIEKELPAFSFSNVIKSYVEIQPHAPTHIPVKFSIILKLGVGNFDLYLKLSETNFVKILHQGEEFFESDAKRLSERGIKELYIKMEDSAALLAILEKDILSTQIGSDEVLSLIDNLEAFERMAKYMKWTPEILESAQKSVTQAVKILSKKPNIISVLKKRLAGSSTTYAQHIGMQTYLLCAIGSSIGWVGESGQIKLALASLLHDVAVSDVHYENIREWNKKASDLNDKSPEVVKYRMHPIEATKLLRSLDSMIPDVEQIILQHHEKKDGKGYPRSLDSGRIGQLPALFIIVEDLVDFIGDGENLETSITDFFMWGDAHYDSGHMKKMFHAFKGTIKD